MYRPFWRRWQRRDYVLIDQVIAELNYDFDHFELASFIQHIAHQRRRPIHCQPMAFARTLFGVWVPGRDTDYIFYNAAAQPVHQTHIVLHELAHLLLEHAGRPLHEVLSPELLAQLGSLQGHGHQRSASPNLHEDPQEQDAEQFVYRIQRRLVRARRLDELIRLSTSIASLRALADAASYGGR